MLSTTHAGRRRLYRLLAMLIGVSPFFFAEVGLRLAGIGELQADADPFVEFEAIRPLFALNAARDQYEIPVSRRSYFKHDSFAARKAPREFRIFCLGGSTVQGNPYSIETSFTTWLELGLRAADPNRSWEVVNCGGISYATYRLLPILRECLQYQPDLIVLYVGDNEFLEARSYAHIQQAPARLRWLKSVAARSHLYNLVGKWYRQSLRRRSSNPLRATALSAEVDPLLDYEGGLAQYHRDDTWQQGVTEHFRHSLSSMLRAARLAKVPVLLVDPVSNIKDCPPFKAVSDSRLSETDRQRLADLLASTTGTSGQPVPADLSQRIAALEQARDLDPRHAGIQFALGGAYLEAGRDEEARAAFLRAKDEDVCPLRLTEPLRAVIDAVANEARTPVVPVFRKFEQSSPHGIPGDEMLLDHVHPNISGHQLIADLLLTAMQQQGWVQPAPGWHERRRQLFTEQLAMLDAPYFARGQEHLVGLRRWTQGRAKKLRATLPVAK